MGVGRLGLTVGALAAALSLTGIGGLSQQRASGLAPGVSSSVPVLSVDPAVPGRAVPAGFLGVSVEYWALVAYAGEDPRAVDPVLVQLLRNLAGNRELVLRIGGLSTDTTWLPSPRYPPPRGGEYALSASRVAVIGALARAARAHLILGINLEADSPPLAAAEARALVAAVGRKRILAFELGNEPESYSWAWVITPKGIRVPGRPPGYDLTDYVSDWTRISPALPRLPLAGPASGSLHWLAGLPSLIAAEPRLRLVTVHRYPLVACAPPYPPITQLLSPASTAGLALSVTPALKVARAHHLAFRIDETNTIACGAAPNISDTFATALWVVGALFSDLQVGVDGVNIHTYPGAPYQLFRLTGSGTRWSGLVEPEYYGLLMFAQAAPVGARLLRVSGAGGKIKVWATRGLDRMVRVELVNDDPTRAHTVAIAVRGERGPATLERLVAANVRATSGVTLGGRSFGNQTSTGRLAGRLTTVPVDPSHGTFVVRMPAGSAALLTMR